MELPLYVEWHAGETAAVFVAALGNKAAFAAGRREEAQM